MEGRWEGAQEEKAWVERILTGHTKAAGSTCEVDSLGIHNPWGSLWCAIKSEKDHNIQY